MKKLFIILAHILNFSCLSFSQHFLNNLYFNFDVKNKWEIYATKKSGLFLENYPYNSNIAWLNKNIANSDLIYQYNIGYTFGKHHEIELGYATEQYHGGFKLKYFSDPIAPKSDHIYGINLETGENVVLRYGYKIGKKRLQLKISAAYTLGHSGHYKGFWPFNEILSSRGITENGKTYEVVYQASDILHVDYGLSEYYSLLDGHISLEYRINKYLGIYYGGGYTQGFNTMAYYNVKYTVKGYPQQHAINEIKGTNYYYNFGLKLYPFAKIKGKVEKK